MPTLPRKIQDPAKFLRLLFDRAIAAADPEFCVPPYLPSPPKGKTLLVAAGKAAASMARAVEQNWPGDAPLNGTALTRYGHGLNCNRIVVIEAAHPVPDDRGFEAAKQLKSQIESLGGDDLLLFLVSGGGSALLTLPADSISLEEKQAINKALLFSGAPIGEMNVVRKHLSAVKGGRLAASAHPASVVTLAISDVPGDDPSTIASGPTVPDTSTSADALKILNAYNIKTPPSVLAHLKSEHSETPKPSDPVFARSAFIMVATPTTMLQQVITECTNENIPVTGLGANIEGEARDLGKDHARLALSRQSNGETGLILSGGETTVTVNGETAAGRGGRNCEYLLSLAISLDGAPGIWALAADTDGIDGSEDNAGAVLHPDTLTRARSLGLDAQTYLDSHDSYSFFEKLGDLIKTGPTLTNVNDFRAIWIAESG